MGNNTIASMITSIRNANLRRTKVVQILATNTTRDIGKILLRQGFMESLKEHQGDFYFF
jgi:small subunit ribosomal protein S8